MNVLVIGDSCKDEFIYGECSRICPEAPVPVFNPVETKTNRGMAANVFDNLQSLAKGSINLTLITNHEDIIKTRYVDRKTNQMLLRVDKNDTCKRVTQEMYLPDYDAVVISDYNKGLITKKLFKEVNGYSSLRLMEDVELSNKLLEITKPKMMKSIVYTSARRLSLIHI